jgi:cytochrome b561
MPKIFSDLNLHGAAPPRVQPKIGEWGPERVPTTRAKRRMRIWVGLVLLGTMIAIFLLGWYAYYAMTGSWGFGIGDEQQILQSVGFADLG